MRRCPSCGEENADRARFCQACATPLGETGERPSDVRRVVTIVFADVTGSTDLGERLDPEALRRVMNRYFDRMSEVIQGHGGTVEKFIGDAVMAVFGIPRLHEDDALRAVRAADDMRTALRALNEDLEREHGVGITARIGVNTGEVVAGDPSAGQRLVTGDAVNVAARLEQAARPGEILLGEPTYRLVRDAVDVEPVEPLDLKGKTERVAASRLLAVRPGVEGHERRLDSPMVGRARELVLLSNALERVVSERTSHLFTLLGPAGVGKSRLVREFLDGPVRDASILRGRCLSYGDGITFYPLAEVVQDAAGIGTKDDVITARRKLMALLEGADDAQRIVASIGGLLAWDEPGAVDDAFWAVRKLFEHLASDRPLVVVFDDIHWAEPVFLDLLEHLADWTRDASVLLLCVTRPELLEIRPGWSGGKMNATSILLEPLDGEAASVLVDNLLGAADIPPTARRRILDAAEGNPLFVEEMLGMLIDDGLLRHEGGAWHAVDDLAAIAVPPTIQLLLAARLDRLDAEERAVIERGAVEGKVFHAGAVATLASESLRPHVSSRLLALARKELIRPDRAEFVGEDAFRFRHLLIRDAAYQAMPKEQRAELHERFAAWLELAAAERLPEFEEILAYHLEQAYRFRIELGTTDARARELASGAARHAMSSAERAIAREDYPAARHLLTRCAELSEGLDRVHALIVLTEVAGQLNEYPAATASARTATDEARDHGERALELRAELLLVESVGQTDPTRGVRETAEAIVRIRKELESLDDGTALARALLAEARHEFYMGHCDRARDVVEGLLARGLPLRPLDRRDAAIQLGIAAYFGSTPIDEVLRIHERVRGLRPEGILSEAGFADANAALLAMAGRDDEASAERDRAERLWAEVASPELEANRYQSRGEGMLHLGRLEEAERYFRRGREILDGLGETGFNSTMSALHAGVLARLGRFDEAAAAIARSREMAPQDDFATQVAWRRAQARILSARREHDEAVGLLDEAIGIVDTTDYLDFRAETYATRGAVLREAGRLDEARASFGTALELYERKGAAAMAGRMREALAALAAV